MVVVMTIQKIIPKTEKSLRPTNRVKNIKDIYVQQAIRDLLDTLKEKQRALDLEFPNMGAGVGLAANQIEYPYEPVSAFDATPKPGFYPKDFTPPNIYVVSIRKERAVFEKCDVVEPSVYVNATFEPLRLDKYAEHTMSHYEEGCLSVVGFKGFRIPRYEHIKLSALDETGRPLVFSISGFGARVHQHELDHGLGKEYLNQLNFNTIELLAISKWIDEHEILSSVKAPVSIIENKLLCVADQPDFGALRIWVKGELCKLKYGSDFFKAQQVG
jgi:peptide deformylase